MRVSFPTGFRLSLRCSNSDVTDSSYLSSIFYQFTKKLLLISAKVRERATITDHYPQNIPQPTLKTLQQTTEGTESIKLEEKAELFTYALAILNSKHCYSKHLLFGKLLSEVAPFLINFDQIVRSTCTGIVSRLSR